MGYKRWIRPLFDRYLWPCFITHLLISLLFFINSGGPDISPKKTWDTERISKSIRVDDRVRDYILHLPKNRDKATPLPLVFVLHGGRGSPEDMEKISRFHTLQTPSKFITVYPASVDKFWNDGRAKANSRINDVKFINSLVDTLQAQYSIYEEGIFSTGLSNGGTMSVRLGCESEKIKAFSTVASTAVKKVIDNCDLDAPKPLMIIQGTDDPVTNFEGIAKSKRKIVSHQYAIEKFRSLNGCNDAFTKDPIPNTTADGTFATIKRYEHCNDGSKVVSVVVEHGGHTWPGAPEIRRKFLVGRTSHDFNASKVIWQFFKNQLQ